MMEMDWQREANEQLKWSASQNMKNVIKRGTEQRRGNDRAREGQHV